MKQIYDFNAHTPPVVTAYALEQTRKRRAFEHQILLLSVVALLLELCAVAAVVLLSGLSLYYGIAGASVLCLLQMGGGLVLTAFLKNRKSNEFFMRRLTQ